MERSQGQVHHHVLRLRRHQFGSFLVENYKVDGEKENIDASTWNVYLFEKDGPYADVLDYAYNLSENIKDKSARKQIMDITADLNDAIADARVYVIAGLQRKDAKGKLVVPEHQSYSVGVSLYSPVKDEPYQKYASVYKASAFDAATQWSKFLDVNQISVMGEDAMNPCNDSSWELFWLDD